MLDEHHGVRILEADGQCVRLFLLSILWRAAETSLPAFQGIQIDSAQSETLRHMIVNRKVEPIDLFPVTLTQISTLGPRHNMVGLAQVKLVPRPEPLPPEEVPIFRFYLDGLIAHFHRDAATGFTSRLGAMVVGAEQRLAVSTVSYEASWQLENVLALLGDSEKLFPDQVGRLLGGGSPPTR